MTASSLDPATAAVNPSVIGRRVEVLQRLPRMPLAPPVGAVEQRALSDYDTIFGLDSGAVA